MEPSSNISFCPMAIHLNLEKRLKILDTAKICKSCCRDFCFCSTQQRKRFQCSTCRTHLLFRSCAIGHKFLEERRKNFQATYMKLSKKIFPIGMTIPIIGNMTKKSRFDSKGNANQSGRVNTLPTSQVHSKDGRTGKL